MKNLVGVLTMVGILTCGLAGQTLAGVWGLWNDPPASRPLLQPQQDNRQEQLQSATERAKQKKLLALEAMRHLEKARRAAQQAEAEKLAEEKALHDKQEYQQLQQRAAREHSAAQQARQDSAQLQSLQQPSPEVQPAEQQADLLRLRQMAAKEQADASAAREQAELDRLRQMAVKEQKDADLVFEQAELDRLRAMAAKEQADANTAREQAELDRLRQMAAKEQQQAELDRLRTMAAKERQQAEHDLSRKTPTVQQTPPTAPVAPVTPAQAPVPAPATLAPQSGARVEPIESGAAATAAVDEYLLGPGDMLEVSVWKDDSLSRTVMVAPDGNISLPLAGEIKAEGRTLAALKSELEGRLAIYVPDPIISLDVKQTNSMQIYVIGKVNSPGRFVISSNINVLQALAMAGGLNPFADKDDIRIMREQSDSPARSFDFNYKKVLRGENLEQNIRLQRGDVIVVP